MASQREIVRRFVVGQHGVLDQEFSEVETGKKTSERRPQLAAASVRCKRTKATLVIAKLDRLARNAEFLLRLQNSGVDFVCCDCPNADKFTVGILALVAQRERELISERTRLALAAAKSKGVKLGTPNPQKAVAAMVTRNKTAKAEFTERIFPLIQGIQSAGVSTLQELRIASTAGEFQHEQARPGTRQRFGTFCMGRPYEMLPDSKGQFPLASHRSHGLGQRGFREQSNGSPLCSQNRS